MSRKNKKESETVLSNLYSPYFDIEHNTMDDWFPLYESDDNRATHLVRIENICDLKINDVLVDETGREFVFMSCEMLRFSGEIPEWYFKTSGLVVKGNDYSIGEYLAKK